ncbi:MAG TPA: bifunctional glycosyltransferase family 2/GtrA family protein [Solirubrobacteraceae bacterium]|nr:bifunctional glycosyltransferase family 2/GtrA family protein [Solirubrobacteraceae bacterium]
MLVPAPEHQLEPVPVDLEVVVPVHNEEGTLALSIQRLHRYLSSSMPLSWRILIADNASSDATPEIAQSLAVALAGVSVLRLEQKGRGRALRTAWSRSSARVVAYMDVDLSTDLRALLPLVAPLLSGHSELAIGTRLAPGSRITRGPKRELISRSYNHLLRAALRARFSDAQCGFKAVRGDVLAELLAAVEDQGWFFDTELLIAAQRRGMRIHEVAVDWVDDPDSRVDIVSTALADLRGVARLLWQRRLARFMTIGIGSTLAYALLFIALAATLGSRGANLVALTLTAVANTAANRRVTFGVRGRRGIVRDHLGGLLAYVLSLALTDAALVLLHRLDARPPRLLEVGVLVIASLCATAARYVGMASWLFPSARRPQRERKAISSLSTQGN